MEKGIIIAGFTGVGKTSLAKKYANVLDLEIMDFKWNYETNIEDVEQKKGSNKKKRKNDWPMNYLNEIKNAMQNYDIILISTDNEILNLLDSCKIQYIICYPYKYCKQEYLKRYKERGNTKQFIDNVNNTFDELIEQLENAKCKKIKLGVGESLESKLRSAQTIENEMIEK